MSVYWDVGGWGFSRQESHSGTRIFKYFLCNCSVVDQCSRTASFVLIHHSLSYVTSTTGMQSVRAAIKINATECNVDFILMFSVNCILKLEWCGAQRYWLLTKREPEKFKGIRHLRRCHQTSHRVCCQYIDEWYNLNSRRVHNWWKKKRFDHH